MVVPDQIGRYQVQSLVGVGGFAVVVRAHDEALDDAVAIKILSEHWAGDADVQDRFLEEARLLRRVRSDHLVTVHDLGRLDDGRPYFVMEFADRGVLADRLGAHRGAGLDPASARLLIQALADSLGALHRAGVVHRDVNPRNLFLKRRRSEVTRGQRAPQPTQVRSGVIASDERVLLGDLGLAKDLVQSGAAVSVLGGTPRYQAPEQADGRTWIQPATDVYGATGVMWEAITGSPPPLPADLAAALSAVQARWRPFFGRGLTAQPEERFQDMESWQGAALDVLGTGEPQTAILRATAADARPYKGLAAFQPEDVASFFGRDRMVGELVERLVRERVLVVGGPSGSGKSSLVRAGLIPAVQGGALPGSERWPVALFTPRRDGSAELEYQLEKAANAATMRNGAGAEPAGAGGNRSRALAEVATSLSGGLLLVIDQFEEVFTQGASWLEQQRFIDQLAEIVDPIDSRVRLVIALRADFYGSSALFPWLAQRITLNQVLVGPMDRSELREAIVQPAHGAGARLEEGLVELILDQGGSEPGALPLVSHALAETWLRRRGGVMTIDGYRMTGGVAGAIAQTADALYQDRLDAGERSAARRLLLRLVTPGEGTSDTRRPLPIAELASDPEPLVVSRVTDELVSARLLTVDRDTVEIAHEALIQTWPRLRGWIEESRDDLRARQRIGRASAEWVAEGRLPDLLYRGTLLRWALEWRERHGDDLSTIDREFLEASEAERQLAEAEEERRAQRSRRWRRVAVSVLAALAAVAVAASVVAYSGFRQATARLAQSLARQAEDLVDTDPRLALALAMEAIARGGASSVEARTALVDAVRTLDEASFAPATTVRVGDALSVASHPDGEIVVTGDRGGSIRVWDPMTGSEVGSPLVGHEGGVEELVFFDGGRKLLSTGDDGTIRIWDLTDPAGVPPSGVVGTVDDIVWGAAVSPDDRMAATATEDGTIRLWDLEGMRQLGPPLIDVERDFLSVAFSPAGNVVLAGNGRGELTGWRLPDRTQVLAPFNAHDSDLWEIVFDPSGDTVATASSDGRVRVWDFASGALVVEPFEGRADDVRGVQFSSDGRTVVAGDEEGRARVWDLVEGTELPTTAAGHDGQVLDASLSMGGTLLVTLGSDQMARIWTRGDSMGTAFTGHDGGARAVAVSADGTLLISGDGEGVIRLFDIATGRLVLDPLPTHDGSVWGLAFNPTGDRFVSGGADGRVIISNTESGAPLFETGGHEGAVSAVVFTEGRILSGGEDGVVRAWGDDGAPLGSFGPVDGAVTALALGAQGTLAVADRSGAVQLWRLDTGAPVGQSLVSADTIWDVAWSPDGSLLATAGGDGAVVVWDAANGQPIHRLTPHDGGALAVRFLGDGATLAATSGDGSVRLWDVERETPIGEPLTWHQEGAWRLVVHPDGARFFTASGDGAVRLWHVLDAEQACDLAGDAFDEEQRARYLGVGEEAAGCREAP